MKKIQVLYLFILIILIIIGAICVTSKKMENDTFFTIATGNYIMDNGLDECEPFTFHNNLKYIKLRYGFDVLIANIYNIFNYDGIYFFTIIMSIAISISLFYVCFKISNLPTVSAILVMIMLLNVRISFVARAQIISFLIFVWEFYFIIRLFKTSEIKYAVAIVLLSFAMLLFHSSVWILYPVLFLPFLVQGIIDIIFEKKGKNNIKLMAITFLMVLVSRHTDTT